MLINIKEKIAAALLECGAVFLSPNEPFTWASGIKSPIYCDNRVTLSYPQVRNLVTDSFVKLIKSENGLKEVEIIAGVATSGIPYATLVADKLNLPMVYVRSSAKEHGRENLIEGKLSKGQKVVVIEDLISTGGSGLRAIEALRNAGADVSGLVAIFTYQLTQAKQNFENARVPCFVLSDYDTLVEVALKQNIVKDEDLSVLQSWKQNT